MITVELTDRETQAVLDALTSYQISQLEDGGNWGHGLQGSNMRQAQQKLLIAKKQQQGNQT